MALNFTMPTDQLLGGLLLPAVQHELGLLGVAPHPGAALCIVGGISNCAGGARFRSRQVAPLLGIGLLPYHPGAPGSTNVL